jgi:hypothetical protein
LKPLRGPGVDGSKLWKFSRLEIDALLEGVAERIKKSSTGTVAGEVVSFTKALLILRRRTCFGTGGFVRAVLKGIINPCGTMGKAGLHSFLFLKNDLYVYALSGGYAQDNPHFWPYD